MENLGDKQYRVAAWKNALDEWMPALVLMPQEESSGVVAVFLTDVPDLKTGSGIIFLPAKDIEEHFIFSDGGICPDELSSEFSEMQSYLIQNNLPMMGPLFYLRTATMMKFDGLGCEDAIARNQKIEKAMIDWVASGSSVLLAMSHAIDKARKP